MSNPDPSHDRPPLPDDLRTRASTPGLSLKDYVEREVAAIAATGGPTMAEILEDLDKLRGQGSPTTEDIVNALHEGRKEREDHLDSLWPQQSSTRRLLSKSSPAAGQILSFS